jgi:acetyl-CoA carboxylase biotin carboxyl carrier protein
MYEPRVMALRVLARGSLSDAFRLGCADMATNVPAHITGTVWKIEVKVGDEVSEGQVLVILESMKMEMPVEAPEAGKVTAISTAEGQAVNEGDTLVVLGLSGPLVGRTNRLAGAVRREQARSPFVAHSNSGSYCEHAKGEIAQLSPHG